MFTIGREFKIVLEVGEGIGIHGLAGLEDGIVEDTSIEIGIGIGGIKFNGFVVVGGDFIPFIEEEIGLASQGVVTGTVGVCDMDGVQAILES
jgi:hypothetical protein